MLLNTDTDQKWHNQFCTHEIFSMHRFHIGTFGMIFCLDRLHNHMIDCINHDSLHNYSKLEQNYAGNHDNVFKAKIIMQCDH